MKNENNVDFDLDVEIETSTQNVEEIKLNLQNQIKSGKKITEKDVYKAFENTQLNDDEIADIITAQEASITASLKALFGESDN